MAVERSRVGRPKKRLVTVDELAEYLHVSRVTVYRLLWQGMPSYRVASTPHGNLRFDVPSCLRWLDEEREKRRAEGLE